MTVPSDFTPDPLRGAALDAAMHHALADSIEHLVQQLNDDLGSNILPLMNLVKAIRRGRRIPSTTFSHYYGAVDCLLQQDFEGANQHFGSLANSKTLPPDHPQTVIGLDSTDAATEYRRCLVPSLRDGLSIEDPSPGCLHEFRMTFESAIGLIESAAPELAGEAKAIIREIVGVTGGLQDTGRFQGASHFQLWGALFLNARAFRTRIEMAEVIAHESAHSFLFGFCTEQPLVTNPEDERYPSPLRRDPRPMDGIYHATFVSARMHWLMRRLLESGDLERGERGIAEKALGEDAANFQAGYTVVRQHAQLSTTGDALMSAARDYMDSAQG